MLRIHISWSNHVRNEEILQRVKGGRNSQQIIKRRKANWIGHILRRNCLLKHVTEGKIEGRIEVNGRRRRRWQLPDGLMENRGHCKLKEEALARTLWRTRLRKAVDLSYERLMNERTYKPYCDFYTCDARAGPKRLRPYAVEIKKKRLDTPPLNNKNYTLITDIK
jgi:hypothetical protein